MKKFGEFYYLVEYRTFRFSCFLFITLFLIVSNRRSKWYTINKTCFGYYLFSSGL